jgi:hypothetical protein
MTLDKIRIKGGEKRYKRGPGPTGAARLAQRVHRLALDAARLARRPDGDPYAARLREQLERFVDDEATLARYDDRIRRR